MGFKLRRPPFGPVQRGPNRIQLVEIENRLNITPVQVRAFTGHQTLRLSIYLYCLELTGAESTIFVVFGARRR